MQAKSLLLSLPQEYLRALLSKQFIIHTPSLSIENYGELKKKMMVLLEKDKVQNDVMLVVHSLWKEVFKSYHRLLVIENYKTGRNSSTGFDCSIYLFKGVGYTARQLYFGMAMIKDSDTQRLKIMLRIFMDNMEAIPNIVLVTESDSILYRGVWDYFRTNYPQIQIKALERLKKKDRTMISTKKIKQGEEVKQFALIFYELAKKACKIYHYEQKKKHLCELKAEKVLKINQVKNLRTLISEKPFITLAQNLLQVPICSITVANPPHFYIVEDSLVSNIVTMSSAKRSPILLCDCKALQKSGLPCAHILKVALVEEINLISCIDRHWLVDFYSINRNPTGDQKKWRKEKSKIGPLYMVRQTRKRKYEKSFNRQETRHQTSLE